MAQILVRFSPNSGIDSTITQMLKTASPSAQIRIAVYSFTNQAVADALVEAEKRGCLVTVVMDKSSCTGAQAKLHDYLTANGVAVRLLAPSGGIMHDKFIVILPDQVETGSYNYTIRAEKANRENALFIRDKTLAGSYAQNFSVMWAKAKTERTGLARPLARFFRRLRVKLTSSIS